MQHEVKLQLLKDLQLTDLSEDEKTIAEQVGLETLKIILIAYDGQSFHFKKNTNRPKLLRRTITHYKGLGWSIRKIARELDINPQKVRRIIKGQFEMEEN